MSSPHQPHLRVDVLAITAGRPIFATILDVFSMRVIHDIFLRRCWPPAPLRPAAMLLAPNATARHESGDGSLK